MITELGRGPEPAPLSCYRLNRLALRFLTLGEMRAAGVRGLLIYCSDYKCSHWTAISGDRWPDDVRLSDLEAQFVCKACGKRGADVRPDFNWHENPVAAMGYR
jgi:hypothetical protein